MWFEEISSRGFLRKLKSVGRTAAAETAETDQKQLEQLKRLRSEDTPRRLMITHTIESYWIPSQKKTKSKLKI